MKIRPLSAALRKKAEEEINENHQNVDSCIQSLRDWLAEHPHLSSSILPSDQWLIAFLRGNKYNMEKTKDKLEKYYTFKTTVPDLYANRDPFDPQIQELLKMGLFLPLRECAHEDSPRTTLLRISDLHKTQYGMVDLIKLSYMITEILLLEDDNFTVVGEDIIADLRNGSYRTISQFTPALAKKALISAGVLTVRMKSVHIIHAPRGLKMAVTIFKMFFTAKLKKRIYVYNEKYDGIYEFVPETILPVELGGSSGTLQELIDYWKMKVESYRDWFLQHEEPIISEKNGNN